VALLYFELSSDRTGFQGTVSNTTGTSQVITFYAECLRASRARLVNASTTGLQLAPGATGFLTIACPKGALLTGGAFETAGGGQVVYDFSPANASTWQAHVHNVSAVAQDADLAPVCLSFS
jgi:hypothetical protein